MELIIELHVDEFFLGSRSANVLALLLEPLRQSVLDLLNADLNEALRNFDAFAEYL